MLRRVDGNMKEELESLQYFFGNGIFQSMVIIATHDSMDDEHQESGFSNKDMDTTLSTLKAMFGSMPNVDGVIPPVPPVVFLGIDDSPTLVHTKVKEATVINPNGIKLLVSENTCIKCAARIQYAKPEEGGENPKPISVVRPNGRDIEEYSKSMCHPAIIPKYSQVKKVVGGIFHIVTLGIPYLLMENSWPWFNNTEEQCVECQLQPGSEGCMEIDKKMRYNGSPVVVLHTNNIEYIEVLP